MSDEVDKSRRNFLTAATAGMGAVGVAFTAVPFVSSWAPSERAKALGAPVEVDVSKLEPGAMMTILWRGSPVYIVHRTKEMLDQLTSNDGNLRDPESQESDQPAYARNEARAREPQYLVLIGTCTHLGCLPKNRFEPGTVDIDVPGGWPGGFFCPCHGSKFDLAGRVFKDVPAPLNLRVPPYSFKTASTLVVGLDETDAKGAA
ncbi:MAG TPA: ubiquinol-cytochrome c reductase iron-sulfur subunit [Steroidobacteraceae bacterium]|nr:ubiquinol-cytochrome c reductase iron-sulfur subunit [Steroidobacteraceae bacterium]